EDSTIQNLEWLDEKKKNTLLQGRNDKTKEQLYEKLLSKDVKAVSIFDDAYPKRLKNIYDPPFVLYYKGNIPEEDKQSISIVGARMCDEYGRTLTIQIARELALRGVSVISGMAYGVDAASHWGALKGEGKTYAILGCGVDVIYPEKNAKLYHEILANGGGVISEFFPGTFAKPSFFPLRNRIISGMSDAVIVMEAKERSGSIITADLALEQGKDVYALPGRVGDALSFGTNRLIRQGAGIITSVESLIEDLNLERIAEDIGTIQNEIHLEKEELLLYSVLDLHAKNIDDIFSEVDMDRECVINILTSLVTKGAAEECFRNYYKKC
ncbi:MAG: DNA-processing protein DprA, partial [Lachnospiraceae bacterium]|nr:DNA-processing protein DprA [Lachnospiraceae bacterium]